MPIMDGFEATYVIRKREQEFDGRKHIPIIAMTANAIEGDREHCLESGMDDYLTKPINVAVLSDILQKWLPETMGNTMTEILVKETMADCPIEMQRMTDLFGDDEEIIDELLGMFYDSLTPLKVKLTAAVDARDANIKAVAHEIKGSSSNVGAVILGEFAKKFEFAAAQQNWTEIDDLTLQIQSELDRVKQFIENRK
jgi:HPt (histidine-containing phosphotransfer) domain-containing protein